MSVHDGDVATQENVEHAVAARRATPGVVRVNLIPPEIADARRLRGVQLGLAGAVVAAVVAVGALYYQQVGAVRGANDHLTAAKTENGRLVAEQQRLGNVNALYAKVDAANAMLASAQAPQVLWSRYLEDVRLRLPEKTWLTSLALTEAAPPAAAPAAAAPAGTEVAGAAPAAAGAARPSPASAARAPAGCGAIGTIAVQGSGYSHRDTADWLDRLAGLKAVTNPSLTSSTEVLIGERVPTVTWNTTATLTCAALASAGKG